jgi:thiosulfate dehydrogenase [quinone] large subunit
MPSSISTTGLRSSCTTGIGDASPAGATAATSVLATVARAGSLANPSAMAGVPTATTEPDHRGDPNAAERQTGSASRWGMASVYLVLAYEWLLSALNKDLSGTFRSGLANRLKGSLVGNPHGWYVSLLERVVLPHAELFAALTLVGELLVAAGLVWGALLWAKPEWFPPRLRPWLGIGVGGALLGAALMELNYYLLAGQGWPWLKTSDPFVSGIGVDGLVLLISLSLLPIQLVAARRGTGRSR